MQIIVPTFRLHFVPRSFSSYAEIFSPFGRRRIIISKDVYKRVPLEMQSKASFLGEFELKGKAEKVDAYGIV